MKKKIVINLIKVPERYVCLPDRCLLSLISVLLINLMTILPCEWLLVNEHTSIPVDS